VRFFPKFTKHRIITTVKAQKVRCTAENPGGGGTRAAPAAPTGSQARCCHLAPCPAGPPPRTPRTHPRAHCTAARPSALTSSHSGYCLRRLPLWWLRTGLNSLTEPQQPASQSSDSVARRADAAERGFPLFWALQQRGEHIDQLQNRSSCRVSIHLGTRHRGDGIENGQLDLF
jgi:hypothetical protein